MYSGDVVRAGQTGAFNAVKANLRLFAGLMVAALALWQGANLLDPLHFVQVVNGAGHVSMRMHESPMHMVLRNTVLDFFSAFIAAPAMIAVHRHVLLGEDGRVWDDKPRMLRFASFYFVVSFVVYELPVLSTNQNPFICFPAVLAAYWIMGRLVPAYPALALDVPGAVVTGFKLSNHHWWFIVRVMIIGLLPTLLLMMIVGVIGAIFMALAGQHNVSVHLDVLAVLGGLLGLFISTVGAGLASELYRKFGGLAQPA